MSDNGIDYSDLRVLVIEDEHHIRHIVCRLLRQIGFNFVEQATDGGDGFQKILLVRPDIIICDIHMKPINGVTFLRQLRKLSQPKYSEIPVIFLTADKEADTVVIAKEARVDGYLVKPVSQKALQARVEAVLGKPA